MDVTCINAMNEANDIYMSDNKNYIHTHYAPFSRQGFIRMYLQEKNTIKINEELITIKLLFWIYY